MLINHSAGSFKILTISRIENANSCLELLHLALKRRALKGHCGDWGWENMAFLEDGKTNRHLPPCYCHISTIKKQASSLFFQGSQVYHMGANEGMALKSKGGWSCALQHSRTELLLRASCQGGQGADSGMRDLHLTL